ncbi:Uncharacterised protein [Enterococcus durans]|nr:Uncharacterised protein [Enterococcus durans]
MNNVFKPIKYLSIIMLVVIISAVITYIVNPNFSDTLNSVSSNISKSVSQKSGLNLVVAYIFNNGFKVPMGMLFFQLYLFDFYIGFSHFSQPYYLEFYLG